MPKLQGKAAVVTGGSSGIGLATAYITGRRQAELERAVSLIGRGVAAGAG